MIKVSVITVVYNGAASVRRAIESVLGQSYPSLEYIIIDGGSSDGTVDIIREYGSRLAFWTSGPDKGLYDAMNKGLEYATGDLVGVVNADDFLVGPDTIGRVAQAFVDENTLIVSDTVMVSDERERLFSMEDPARLCLRIPFMHTSCFIPRKCFRTFGPYDQTFRIAADTDLLMRMIKGGVTYRKLLLPINKMQVGGVSERRFISGRREYRDAFIRHFGKRPLAYAAFYWTVLAFSLSRMRRRLTLNFGKYSICWTFI